MIRRLMAALSRPLRAEPTSSPLPTETYSLRRSAAPGGNALLAASLLHR